MTILFEFVTRKSGRNQALNLRGPKFFVQKFLNIGILILKVGNNALLALVLNYLCFLKSIIEIYN